MATHDSGPAAQEAEARKSLQSRSLREVRAAYQDQPLSRKQSVVARVYLWDFVFISFYVAECVYLKRVSNSLS